MPGPGMACPLRQALDWLMRRRSPPLHAVLVILNNTESNLNTELAILLFIGWRPSFPGLAHSSGLALRVCLHIPGVRRQTG